MSTGTGILTQRYSHNVNPPPTNNAMDCHNTDNAYTSVFIFVLPFGGTERLALFESIPP